MFNCTSVVLPPEGLKRESQRRIEFRQPGFDQDFDAATLFYDVITSSNEHRNNLIFVGPPLLNLFPVFCQAQIDSADVGSLISNYYLRDRCCDVWICKWNKKIVDLKFYFGSYQLRPQGA